MMTTDSPTQSRDETQISEDADEVDEAEEGEEGPETDANELLEDEDSDEEDRDDPFDVHFANPDENTLKARLQSLQKGNWSHRKNSTPAGKIVVAIPSSSDLEDTSEVATASGPEDLKLKQKLATVISKQKPKFDGLERILAPQIFNYKDLMFCERSSSNSESLRRLVSLHAVNHIFKSVLSYIILIEKSY